MSLSPGTLVSLPAKYNVDDACPGLVPRVYMNDQLNDCVIAARAHQTVRLDYNSGPTLIPDISDTEVSNEYHAEAGAFDVGIVVSHSLARWQTQGWLAGGVQRYIGDFSGPLSLNGTGALAGDATTDLTLAGLQTCVVEHTGVQIELKLPVGITFDNKNSFGPGNDWTDTNKRTSLRHVILLTGYDQAGFIGITWGAQQRMTWAFLTTYCIGVYWVTKNSVA
ncbi:MAG: hypothetical protein LAO56_23665 [Acidobacteriia bacterium]|nr:hypothetical protein [Terriglobia bacterium]